MEQAAWIAIVTSVVIAVSSGCRDQCSDSYCDGNVLYLCVPGRGADYVHIADCAAEGRYCVEYDVDGGGAQCARELEPNPVCAPGNTDDFTCDGRNRVLCDHGYVTSIEDCGGDDLCVADIQLCVARAGIDPVCEGLPQPTSGIRAGYCDGETGLRCVGGYVTEVVECGPRGMQCYELEPGVYPVCVASDTPDSRCTGQQGVSNHCSGNVSVSCANDRLISATDCTGTCEFGFCH